MLGADGLPAYNYESDQVYLADRGDAFLNWLESRDDSIEMIEIDLDVPSIASPISLPLAESIIESCCVEAGLRVTLRGTLKQYPGCVHWHLKHGADKGTLEITLWREQQRIWFNVSANRTADWIGPIVNELKACIERALR